MTSSFEFILAILVCMFVPLVPAILIYKLYPNSKVIVNGPFRGLTVKATGAFGAYFLLLVVVIYLAGNEWVKTISENSSNTRNSSNSMTEWTIKGRAKFLNENGIDVNREDFDKLVGQYVVDFSPDFFSKQGKGDIVVGKIPEHIMRCGQYVIHPILSGYFVKDIKLNIDSNNNKFIDVGDIIFSKQVDPRPYQYDGDSIQRVQKIIKPPPGQGP